MNTEIWWKLCKNVTAGILLSLAAVIGFRYILPALLPFVIALVVSSLIRPCADFCRRHLGLEVRYVSVLMILVIFSLLCLILWTAGTQLTREFARFLVNFTENTGSDSPLGRFMGTLDALREKLPIPESGGPDLYRIISDFVSSGAEKLSSAAASAAAALVKKLPSALISTGVSLIALFYLTLDYNGAAAALRDFLPNGTADRITAFYRRVSRALWEYLRAYFTIMLVTFAELYLGFTLLRIEYAMLFAFVTALIDILPILGVGTVLIPWGGAALLMGDYKTGIGILVIYAVVCVVRQFIEPKIVGSFIGTHPVIALVGVYTGLRLFGFIGMIAAPIILYLIRALRKKE